LNILDGAAGADLRRLHRLGLARKGAVSLLIGRFRGDHRLNRSGGVPRFTSATSTCSAGDFHRRDDRLFAVSECCAAWPPGADLPVAAHRQPFAGWGRMISPTGAAGARQVGASSIGALPGAGADIAAWVAMR
jgi:hypothetical protein